MTCETSLAGIPMLVAMADDFDDTVLVPPRADGSALDHDRDRDDTVLTMGQGRKGPVPPVAPRAVDTPAPTTTAHFALRIGLAGQLVPLDVACYIGRNPHPPRIARGASPRLVTVPSPGREVSATHLEVREVGTAVVVTDLKSTNGTSVLTPGNPPRSLRQGESLVVAAGTLLDLGDDNVVQVVAVRRPAASDGVSG